MKNLTIVLLFVSSICCGQKFKSYQASNGVTYNVGDTITLNKGTDVNGSFKYMILAGGNAAIYGQQSAHNVHTGLPVLIKKIQHIKEQRKQITVFRVDGGMRSNFILYIEKAIENCEIKRCKKKR